MKFYFKTLLPYFIMLFVNYFVAKFAFIGMSAPYDWSFMLGLLALGALVVADVKFIISRVKKIVGLAKNLTNEEPHEDVPPSA